jgi:hypothetical protein
LGAIALGLIGTVAALFIRAFTTPPLEIPVTEEAIAAGKFVTSQQDLPLYTENPTNRPDMVPQTLPIDSVFQVQLAEAGSPWIVVTVCRAAGTNLNNQLGWIPRDRLDPTQMQSVTFTACQEPTS